MAFIPKDPEFFTMFERSAFNVADAAGALQKFMQDFSSVVEKATAIHGFEHHGDRFTHETIDKLNRTFITPFERDDIHDLICRLDDVLDSMDEAASRMVLYKVEKPTVTARELSRCLVDATAVLRDIMPCLRNLKDSSRLLAGCRRVHEIESEADRISQEGVALLFESKDAIEVIKWKDIYYDLEKATDKCEDVANILEAILIKNS